MAKSAQQIHQAWLNSMQSPQAQQNYNAGVDAVTQSPTVAAATPEAQNRFIMGVQQSVNSGRRAESLNNVSLSQWQQAAKNKGASRLASGAQAAAQKHLATMQKWAPVYEQAKQAARALPKGGRANAMARVAAALDVMQQAAGRQ